MRLKTFHLCLPACLPVNRYTRSGRECAWNLLAHHFHSEVARVHIALPGAVFVDHMHCSFHFECISILAIQ